MRCRPLPLPSPPLNPAWHAGSLAPLLGTIVAVIVSNLVALAADTEGVYESELEKDTRITYLPQVCGGLIPCRCAASALLRPAAALCCCCSCRVGLHRVVRPTTPLAPVHLNPAHPLCRRPPGACAG